MRLSVRSLLPGLLGFLLSGPALAGFAEEITDAHNRLRSEVGVPPLFWSDTLAAEASRHAERLATERNCKLFHSGRTEVGENLFWSSPNYWSDGTTSIKVLGPSDLLARWGAERANYDPVNGVCRPGTQCGHWTQVVWGSTERLGCGVAICPDNGQIWVCQYDPPGNFIGERPF